MGPNTQTQGSNSKISPSISLKLNIPDKARILIVCDDEIITERLTLSCGKRDSFRSVQGALRRDVNPQDQAGFRW
jgi:hypothetical protein